MNFLQLNVKCATTKIHLPSHHIGDGALSRLENNLEGNICKKQICLETIVSTLMEFCHLEAIILNVFDF